jgi:RimJ/RimL family protein N-acetyltransferase
VITFVLTYTPGWEETIEDVILRGKDPIPDRRHTYVFEGPTPISNEAELLKPGYDLRPIDMALLADQRLGNVQALQAEVLSEAPSTEEFLRDRFGVCVVRDDQEIIGWALSEYNLGNRCEVGIETVEGYRRQGIATVTGSALVEEAVRRGITRIGWHCWASNAGSIATALRLGFEKVAETDVYFAWFDRVLNLAVNGNMLFFQDAYPEALTWYERAFEAGATTAPWWAYWNAARAAASINQGKRALRYLQKAIAGGFQDVEALQSSEHLTTLHDLTEWDALLSSLDT